MPAPASAPASAPESTPASAPASAPRSAPGSAPRSAPASAPGTPHPIAPGTPPEDAIRRVCAQLAQKPAAAWVAMLDFVNLQGSTATFAPKRGRREVLSFAKGPMGRRLADSLSEALGQNIKLAFLDQSIDTPPGSLRAPGSPGSHVNQSDRENHGANAAHSGGPGGPGASAHSVARGLPLVRKVLETFPDAVMIDARKLPPGTMPPPEAPEEVDGKQGDA